MGFQKINTRSRSEKIDFFFQVIFSDSCLNFDSVLNEHKIKKTRPINKIFLIRIKPIKSKSPYLKKIY
jgi:hypothetical protein